MCVCGDVGRAMGLVVEGPASLTGPTQVGRTVGGGGVIYLSSGHCSGYRLDGCSRPWGLVRSKTIS